MHALCTLRIIHFVPDQMLLLAFHCICAVIYHPCLYSGAALLQKCDDLELDALFIGVKKPQGGLKSSVLSNPFQASSSAIWILKSCVGTNKYKRPFKSSGPFFLQMIMSSV